jgi:ABC-type transport system involved in multi-copper enzyme maturation permease subunit
MIWLTWRQFRPQAVTSLAALAAFAILLGATAPHLTSLYASSGITACHGQGCDRSASNFLGLLSGPYTVVFMLGVAGVVLAPALIGVFWGAPLIAREFETGTFRMAWTQSVSRARLVASKLALPAWPP